MKPYHQITKLGKLRRLRNLALVGLTHYNIKQPTIAYHGFKTNLLYRATSATGEKFMLRLACPGWRTLEDLQSEAMWLMALRQETNISVPTIIPTQYGEYVLSLSTKDIPDVWHMTLMTWIPGRLMAYYLTPTNLEKMGILFSELHCHAENWAPPNNFTERRFEYWLSRGEENLISKIEHGEADNFLSDFKVNLTPTQRKLIIRMDEHVKSTYKGVDRSDLRVIHCDLWHENIKLYDGKLYPFDFEDTVWGYRAHDIAMAMLDLLETVGDENYPELLESFINGYETNLPWPIDPIEPFQIGRLLWKLNWIARFQPDDLENAFESYLSVFEIYERTGKITLPK